MNPCRLSDTIQAAAAERRSARRKPLCGDHAELATLVRSIQRRPGLPETGPPVQLSDRVSCSAKSRIGLGRVHREIPLRQLATPGLRRPTRPVAPYHADPRRAAANCFDRLTGDPIPADRLKTYAEALADYHLHPETKFLNGEYIDRGPTVRRRVHVAGVRYIGKEANRWEEQFYLWFDPETQIEHDGGPDAVERARAVICNAAATFGQRSLARVSGVAREQLRAIASLTWPIGGGVSDFGSSK
jgi:hypothetical protein